MPGREGEQARPGDGCGQCCGWSQGQEPALHTAPTSLGCTSYPLPAPVVDLGPGWGKSWNSKPLSRPFPGVPSVCSLKHELQYVLQRPPLYFKPRALPQGYPKTSGMESRGPKSQTAHGLEPRSYPAALTSLYRATTPNGARSRSEPRAPPKAPGSSREQRLLLHRKERSLD